LRQRAAASSGATRGLENHESSESASRPCGLLIGNWWSLVVLTASAVSGVVSRIHVEWRALLQNLGGDYRDYAATHQRLVPFVW